MGSPIAAPAAGHQLPPGPASPPAPPRGGPVPDPQRGGGAEPGSVSFTPSPPLCGGGWCLSRVTYTDMHFLKDFFFLVKKKTVEKPQVKLNKCNSKEAAEAGFAVTAPAGR